MIRNAHSAEQLLKVAGELFLRDYPVNMDRVTAIEQASPVGKQSLVKGSIIVDLPTYQWNYAKNLWAEPRQSAEHRAPQHARHDILGSRMPSGSKSEPMWRNMFRIRDLPCLKHHSLGGEAVFPTAGYFSMAIEAITQLNEDSSNSVKIQDYVMRDVSIKTALVTPDNDTGIKVMFNMRPSVYSDADSQNTSWDFNVSSISEVGHWRDHITGTISINSRLCGETPKIVPNLPQRATGKSWNQGLRDVGFDYGSTFQDMQDIRSDSKNYIAASKTIVKQECGAVERESRYALHPATVDSCLQLVIVSIYAGRLKDMTCGALPIQVDEVAIWAPTVEQLNSPGAQAHSWTDQRGIRSFVSGSQLVTSDGELLMDITGLRCVAYEAAVPQKAGTEQKTQPYGEMVWKYDIDSLTSSAQLGITSVDDLIDLFAQKNPAVKVLDLGSGNALSVISKCASLNYTISSALTEVLEVLKTTIPAMKNVNFLQLDISESQSYEETTYNLIVATGQDEYSVNSLSNVRSILATGGRVIMKEDAVTTQSLTASGFSGIDIESESENSTKLVLSTAVETAQN